MGELVLTLPVLTDDIPGSLIRRIFERVGWNDSNNSDQLSEDAGEASFYMDSSDTSDASKPWDNGGRSLQTNGTYHVQRAGELIDKYGNSILRMAYSYLHNLSDAEDILQDTLIQYLKTKPELVSEVHEKAWLLKVACNLSKNRIKYNKLRETDELLEEIVGSEEEDLKFVWEAVKELPSKYREVIHLFYQEDYSTKDIAKILQRNEATVRSDLNRARKQLKNILKEAYDFE